VVVETFIAMLILAVASGMIVDPNASAMGYGRLLLGMGAFYAFFVWVAVWAVPKVVSFFEKIDNDELFILFALGIVFLTSGIASLMNVPPIIGAFFIGMVLAESKVSERVEAKLESFKDAFVAIFFTSFGMMIDPSMFKSIYWMILLAVPLVLFYEIFVISTITYFLGFSARASTTIGTSMCGRGVESILFASVGSRVKDATMGAQLNPFAGAFCFVMSAITPPLVKHSAKLASAFTKVVPRSLRFSGAIVSRTLGKVILPSDMNSFKGAKVTAALLVSLVFVCVGVLVGPPYVQDLLLIAGIGIIMGILLTTRKELGDVVAKVDYSDIGVGPADRRPILHLISTIILGAVLVSLLICLSWGSGWELAAAMAAGYAIAIVAVMIRVHRILYRAGDGTPQKVYHMTVPLVPNEQGRVPVDMPSPVYVMHAFASPPMPEPMDLDLVPEPRILHQGER
jgi:Kef-type K+ transport system membrane component KefB